MGPPKINKSHGPTGGKCLTFFFRRFSAVSKRVARNKRSVFSLFFFSFLLLHCWLVSHQQMSDPMAATGTSPTRPFDLGSRKVAIRFLPEKPRNLFFIT